MKKIKVYNVFLGLLSLMNAVILSIKLMYDFPYLAHKSLLYINLIISIIFLIDLIIKYYKMDLIRWIIENKINIIATIPIILIEKINLTSRKELLISLVLLTAYAIRFKNDIRELVTENKFSYMIILTTIIIVIGSVFMALVEEMSFIDAVWWSFVTFTTVGYGDVLIKTTMGKVVGIMIMTLGVGFISITASTLAVYFINKDGKQKRKEFKGETLDFIKYKIDNIDNLSDNEIDDIYKTLKGLKKK